MDLIIISEEINPHQKSSTYGKPFHVATSVKGKPLDESVVIWNKLTTDQVHVFGRNMGVPGCFFQMEVSMLSCHCTTFQFFVNGWVWYGLSPTTQVNQTTSNLCRAIIVVFSESFVNDMKTVNNRKTRIDHETGNTHKHFWICATLAYNNQQDDDVVLMVNKVVNDTFDMTSAVATEFDMDATDDDSSKVVLVTAKMEQNTNQKTTREEFSLIVVPTNDPYLADLEDNDEIDLEQFEMMEMAAYRKKIIDLFKIQHIMKKT